MVRMTWRWLCLEIRVIKWYYWLMALTLFCFVYRLSRKKASNKDALIRGALATYILLIIISTILNRGISLETYNLVPFWTIRALLSSGRKDVISQAFLNILLFLPFGFLNAIVIQSFYKNKTILFRCALTILPGIILSIAIETVQFITHRGLCETDDVIHNTLGTLIGYSCWLLIVKARGNIMKTRNKIRRSE